MEMMTEDDIPQRASLDGDQGRARSPYIHNNIYKEYKGIKNEGSRGKIKILGRIKFVEVDDDGVISRQEKKKTAVITLEKRWTYY